jgi:hypothetical protein
MAAIALVAGPRRSDEGDVGGLQGLYEAGVLGQEAEARMDRLGAAVLAGLDDFLDHQIALGRRRRADQDRLVGQLDVQRPGVGLGIDRHGLDAHAPRRLDDAAGDLAPVGDQDLVEHLAPLPRGQAAAHSKDSGFSPASPKGTRATARNAETARSAAP